MRKKHPQVEVHIYHAGHGFNCDQRGSFDAPSAKLARERTLQFLQQHVKR
jgi:carboxymethylenebutenolidase